MGIEGGCYAKAINLTREQEPEIFDAIRFGSVVENVVFNKEDREVDYFDTSITENTRAAYPLHYIANACIPAKVDTHPSNIVLLCCDAFGVLPPVSKLTPAQVQYYFIQGYTAKVAGTEIGVTEPTATFSACFGAPFLVWHPIIYAEMLALKLQYTRLMVDAINNGTLKNAEFETMPGGGFNFQVPKHIDGVPDELLMPSKAWKDQEKYNATLIKLATLFRNNMFEYADRCPYEVKKAGPFLV